MSLWYVDSKEYQLEKVKDLESSWWNFEEKERKITLSTTLNKKDINIEIEKTGYNNGSRGTTSKKRQRLSGFKSVSL